MSDKSSKNIIHQAVAGDRAALERLLIEYEPQLTAHITARFPASLRSTYSVEDVTQEALTRAFLKIGYLRHATPQAFVVWLKAVGEKTLMELIKSQGRLKRGGTAHRIESPDVDSWFDILDLLPAESATASQQVARSEALAAMRVSIAGLATDQRIAIELHLLEKLTLRETAQAMGRSMPAIRGLVQRGKSNLAEAMGRASAWLSTR